MKLSDKKIEEVRENLCNNQQFCKCFKTFDDRLNELLPVTPVKARNKLYELEAAVHEIICLADDAGYQKGVSDASKVGTDRKVRYMILEMETPSPFFRRVTKIIYRLVRKNKMQ